jgi:hypothetical protein
MFSPVKVITAGAVVFAIGGVMLIAQPSDRQGGSVPGAATDVVEGPGPAALVTGQLVTDRGGDAPFEEEHGVDGMIAQRGRDSGGHVEMSDARLSGDVVLRDNADRWCPEACSPELLSDVLWGTIEVTNDDGSWVGTSVGTTDASAGGTGVTYYELVGAGAYEGLSAILFESETAEGYPWNGVIFPGDLPPDR